MGRPPPLHGPSRAQARALVTLSLKAHASEGVVAARAYVEAMLGLQVWAHIVYQQALADPHAHLSGHEHG